MHRIMHTLRPRPLHSSKERIRISTMVINHPLHRLVRNSLIRPCLFIRILEREDQVGAKRLRRPATADDVRDGVGADGFVEGAVGDVVFGRSSPCADAVFGVGFEDG